MSITVSIYDLFAYMIPGLLYIFTFNELSHALGYSSVDVTKSGSLPSLLLLGLLAYLTGQIMDFFCRLWSRIWFRRPMEEKSYRQFRNIHPTNVHFAARQWPLLLAFIRREDRQTADMIDQNIARSIMLRDVSFGLFLFGLLQIFLTFRFQFSFLHLITAIGVFISSFIALRRNEYFTVMFYRFIFQHAVLYGEKVLSVLGQEEARTKSMKRVKAEQ